MDMQNGKKTDLTENWDYTADAIAWNPDGKSIYFLAPYQGVTPIFSVNTESKKVEMITSGSDICDYAALAPVDGKTIVTMRHSMLYPNEIFAVTDRKATSLTNVNNDILCQITAPGLIKEMVPTTDGKEMTTWVVLPPNFDPNKKYPAILYCQGGPQQAVSQFWSYRWNLMLMASNGYVVIAPNRRGLPGFGTEWNAQISGDYPGQNMRDYLSAIDHMKQKPFIDGDHIGAVGASYGGFSVYMLAGIHENRLAALIAHAGIFKTYTIHFFVKRQGSIHIVYLHGKMKFIVPQIIWTVHIPKPGEFQSVRCGLVSHEYQLETSVLCFFFSCDSKAQCLFVKFYRFLKICNIDVVVVKIKFHMNSS